MPVYKNTGRTIAWAYDQSYRRGDLLIDPPEFIVERYNDQFTKLDDDDGTLPLDLLDRMPYRLLQEIAAAHPRDDLSENSQKSAILDALGYESETGEGVEDEVADTEFRAEAESESAAAPDDDENDVERAEA